MSYTINQWYGRVGNNIQQITNAIYYCKENKINFYSPPHPLIKSFKINFGVEACPPGRYFFLKKDFECNPGDLNNSRRNLCLKYVRPNFVFFTKKAFDEKTLVIHLRGGDVFSSNPPNTYVQNPLSFYKDIMKNYENVIVVAEDYKSPIALELKKDKKITIQSTSIKNDFSTLLRAKNLVSSGVGTFSIAAALCSNNINNFYCSNYFLEEHLNPAMVQADQDINFHLKTIDGYIKIGEWENNEKQRNTMITYGM